MRALPFRTRILRPISAHALSQGVDVRSVLSRFGLSEAVLVEPDPLLDPETVQAVLDALAHEARDPFIGLNSIGSVQRGMYGIVEYCCRTAPTLRGALRRLARYFRLIDELQAFRCDERDDGSAVIEQKFPREGRHGNEYFLHLLLRAGEELSGDRVSARRAWLAHSRPAASIAPLVEALGTSEILFDADGNGMVLCRDTLDRPILTADPALACLVEQKAEELLADTEVVTGLASKIRDRLQAGLPERVARLEVVARSLHLSPRTLQRRLAIEGYSFDDLVDRTRSELARSYMAKPRYRIQEVAYRLGYADARAFARAFKRWTGLTPAQFRKDRDASR